MLLYGLLNSDEGVFPEYIRNFLMTAFTLVTQLCMMNLSILVIVIGGVTFLIFMIKMGVDPE